MKRFYVLVFALAAFSVPLWAQAPTSPAAPQEASAQEPAVSDPSARAMRESQRLQKALDLNARQTGKVYKLYFKHFKKETPPFGGPEGMPGRPGRPGGPGAPGGMPGGAGRPMGPRPGGMHGPGPGGPGDFDAAGPRPRMDDAQMRESAEAWQKTLSRKFRKIFTEEQYAAWERMTPAPGRAGRPGPAPSAGECPEGAANGPGERPASVPAHPER